MSADRLRACVIALIVAAAVVSFVGNRAASGILNSLGLTIFLAAVGVYGLWRRAVRNERAARVFDREAKTDEAGTRADQ
jgi:hypothetical protein